MTSSGTYFGKPGYLNSSCIGKSIILMFFSSSRDDIYAFVAKLSEDVSVGVGAHPDGDGHQK